MLGFIEFDRLSGPTGFFFVVVVVVVVVVVFWSALLVFSLSLSSPSVRF